MRMAFFAAKPINTTRPICVKMLLSIFMSQMPAIDANKHIGTMKE